MPRKIRHWFPGATYHIVARGNRHSPLFLTPLDFTRYLTILLEVKEKYPNTCHSYCLMDNHLHLQIETKEHPIGDIMKLAHTKYASYFNHFHQLDGHVFQGRYGSRLILDTPYFLETSRYIHRNPLDANIVKSPEDYVWSSYSSYLNGEINPLIDQTKTLSHFQSLDAYKHFVEEEKKPFEMFHTARSVPGLTPKTIE